MSDRNAAKSNGETQGAKHHGWKKEIEKWLNCPSIRKACLC